MKSRYAIEKVVNGVWTVLMPDYDDRAEALRVMTEMLADGTATRGQIHVTELLVTRADS